MDKSSEDRQWPIESWMMLAWLKEDRIELDRYIAVLSSGERIGIHTRLRTLADYVAQSSIPPWNPMDHDNWLKSLMDEAMEPIGICASTGKG